MRARRTPTASGARGGFSLIELMAVILILGILMAFLIPRLVGMREVVEANATRAFLTGQLAAAIGEIEEELGDAPPSAWNETWGPEPNDLNRGSEILYVSLWSEPFAGRGLSEDGRLSNTDGDSLKRSVTTIPSQQLFELCDDWGNPIAYFHRRDYGRADQYVTIVLETGEEIESTVKALTDPRTEGYYNPRGYQLISAGQDGVFGNGDDITNFKRR